MHPNPAFRRVDPGHSKDMLQKLGFGQISINGADGPLAAHVPFWIDPDARRIEAHLAVSNPILRTLGERGAPALLTVTGPHSYISADWYGIPDQVPTWNYVAVHVRGKLTLAAPESLQDHLNRLSERFENLLPGPNWTMEKVSPQALMRLMRMIRPGEPGANNLARAPCPSDAPERCRAELVQTGRVTARTER